MNRVEEEFGKLFLFRALEDKGYERVGGEQDSHGKGGSAGTIPREAPNRFGPCPNPGLEKNREKTDLRDQ